MLGCLERWGFLGCHDLRYAHNGLGKEVEEEEEEEEDDDDDVEPNKEWEHGILAFEWAQSYHC